MVPTAPSLLRREGAAVLRVESVAGASTVTRAYASDPLKLLTPVARGPVVHACLSTYGGGAVAGDHTRLDIHLAPHTCAVVGTQSSTKIYRDPQALSTTHVTHAEIADGALLTAAPDPVQPFAESRYAQSQTLHLTATASLALVDWMSAGRVARGERWAFASYRSRTEIQVEGTLVLLDQLELEAQNEEVAGAFRTGGYDCLATLVLLGPRLRAAADLARIEIHALPLAPRLPLVASASPLRDGLLVRLAADSPTRIQNLLMRWLHIPAAQTKPDDSGSLAPDHPGAGATAAPAHPWARRW
ncbi:MAG: urease accessory protein UreD [Verrucomicrobiales bacterium]|nr:urease accessory protein UreD [Verrucomicrobiales bacterium]